MCTIVCVLQVDKSVSSCGRTAKTAPFLCRNQCCLFDSCRLRDEVNITDKLYHLYVNIVVVLSVLYGISLGFCSSLIAQNTINTSVMSPTEKLHPSLPPTRNIFEYQNYTVYMYQALHVNSIHASVWESTNSSVSSDKQYYEVFQLLRWRAATLLRMHVWQS